MHPELNLSELLTVSLLFSAFSFAAAVGIIIIENLRKTKESNHPGAFTFLIVNGGAALAAWLLDSRVGDILVLLALGLAINITAQLLLKKFTAAGQMLMATYVQLMLCTAAWGAWFIATIPVSTVTRTLMFTGFSFAGLILPSEVVHIFNSWEVLCRKTWSRPRTPLPAIPRDHYPRVCLQVPAYSEPPEMVMATLDTLARLKYPNFEVMVIDNNTRDPSLWRPVQAHCRLLGERFRFFHVDGLSGAKAGALNFALRHTSPEVEIIGVIDSDYQTDPDFLEKLVGYFDDPKIGFIQTPHDYREWENNPYLKMCYWEYKVFFETSMVSLNEWNSGITVGTMCLVRRKALEEAGGWAEWCVTEDSELAIRIHSTGYSGVYLDTTFGRGLIPETFAGYKKQRFRWTYGPVQELKRHFRLFLPRPFGRRSSLSFIQKVFHLNHGLENLSNSLGLLLAPIGIAIVASMDMHREVIEVPLALWLTASVVLAAGLALNWLTYKTVMKCSLSDTLGAMIASKALNHTRAVASLLGMLTPRIPWHRTNKFKPLPLGLGALSSARTELLLGLAIWVFVTAAFAVLPRSGLSLMILIGALYQSFDYFAAPTLALLAERQLHSPQVQEPAT